MGIVAYSVNTFGTGDLKTGSPTLTMSSGVATFSVAQTGNIGVGCRITYDTSKIAYVSAVNSTTSFDLITATGSTPSDEGSSVTVNSVAHEYASLSAAEAGASDANHLNSTNFSTIGHLLDLVGYHDHVSAAEDTTPCTIDGWSNPSATNHIRVRGATVRDTANDLRVDPSTQYCMGNGTTSNANWISVKEPYTEIQDIDVDCTNTGYTSSGIMVSWPVTDVTVQRIVMKLEDYFGMRWNQDLGGNCYCLNNVFYKSTKSNALAIFFSSSGSGTPTIYCYNNTIHSADIGIDAGTKAQLLCKNNIVVGGTTQYSGTFHSSSDYNLSSSATATGGSNDMTSKTVSFVNTGSGTEDYHLASGDTDAIDNGTDLSGTFTDDIFGATRSGWSVGAHEYLSGGTSHNGSVTDSLSHTDSAVGNVDFQGSLSESISFTDLTDGVRAFFASLTEALTHTDSTAVTVAFFGALTETLDHSDGAMATAGMGASVSDSMGISSAETASASFLASITDSAAFTEQAARFAAFALTVADSVSISTEEAPTTTATFAATITDSTAFSDAASALAAMAASVSDSAVFTDVAGKRTAGKIVYSFTLPSRTVSFVLDSRPSFTLPAIKNFTLN